jgi:Escherichia/Staphylococcus phage prohead protease
MNTQLRETFSSVIREVAEGEEAGSFRGIAASLGVASSELGPVRWAPEALRDAPAETPLLDNHDKMQPLGLARLHFDPVDGLIIDGRLALGLQKARETRSLMAMGVKNKLSIGYSTRRSHMEGGVRVIDAASIFEVSVCTAGADPLAKVLEFNRAASICDQFDPRYRAKVEYEMWRDLQRAARAKHDAGWP